MPLPLPLAPAVTVIQAALLDRGPAAAVPAVTVTVPVAAADVARFDEAGEIVNVHGAPACVTVKVCPAIVIVPVREVVPVLAATLKLTVPLPLPFAPAVTVIQAALLAAVQVHPCPRSRSRCRWQPPTSRGSTRSARS